MKRKPQETKKERKARLAKEGQKVIPRPKTPPKRPIPLNLADSDYVQSMLAGAERPEMTEALLADPRCKIWLEQLDTRVAKLIEDGDLTAEQTRMVLDIVDDWEATNKNRFKSKAEAAASVAQMLDRAVLALPKRSGPVDPKQVHAEARAIGELTDAILDSKTNFVKTSMRMMMPEGQAAVDSYLYCLERLWQGANGTIAADLEDRGKAQGIELARHIWAHCRNARVFEIPPQIWEGMHRIHEQHFMMACAQQNVPQEEALGFLRAQARVQPFPEKLPFDYIYIGFGAGTILDLTLAKARIAGSADQENLVGINLLGYLVCGPNQQVYEMLHVIMKDTDYFLPLAQRLNGEWPFGECMSAWLVAQMVGLINEHNTVVVNHEPTPKMRDNFRKKGKGAPGFLPKPYYTLKLRHQIIDEEEMERRAETGFGRVVSYRYDRRGHERCYIARGPLPLDEKTEKKLLKYGYRLIAGKPDAEDAERLAYRNFAPKRSDEWMAIKVRWIEDAVIGDEKLPYIPAVRVPEKRPHA